MRLKYALHRSPRQLAMLRELIQQKVLTPDRYALFFVTGDGQTLPIKQAGGDIEATSGFVLDAEGNISSFQLGWSAERGTPVLSWEPATEEPHWARSTEYRRAREQVGLGKAPS
jgi:hypothetical protein